MSNEHMEAMLWRSLRAEGERAGAKTAQETAGLLTRLLRRRVDPELREKIASIIDEAHEDAMDRSSFDVDNPDKPLVGAYGIFLDAADRILALLKD